MRPTKKTKENNNHEKTDYCGHNCINLYRRTFRSTNIYPRQQWKIIHEPAGEQRLVCFPAGYPATPHCVNPGTLNSNNQATLSVLVFDNDGNFLGTEILWMAHIYNGQPCPQDEILDLGFAFACHHYAQ
jgi:hypothetical protein